MVVTEYRVSLDADPRVQPSGLASVRWIESASDGTRKRRDEPALYEAKAGRSGAIALKLRSPEHLSYRYNFPRMTVMASGDLAFERSVTFNGRTRSGPR